MDNENIFFFFAGLQQKCVEKLLYQLQKDYKRYFYYCQPHRWCNSQCAHLKCGRLWFEIRLSQIKDNRSGKDVSETGQCVKVEPKVYPISELPLKNQTNDVGLVQNRYHYHLIELYLVLAIIICKSLHLVLNNNSLTHSFY